jgi:sulfoxide reductase heme-binding subunit YedZ
MSGVTQSRPARTPYERFLAERAPWTDRRGRFDILRAAVFAVLLLPAAWMAYRWGAGLLGARPLNAAIHSTGYWAVWILMAALTVTPAKAVLGLPNLVVVRRQIGIAAGAYAGLHLLLYVADQNWRLLTVVTEIAVRFYLTIGFVAFLGLAVLTWTSSDYWVKRLGAKWKRLQKWAYAIGVLAAAHFFMQSKADVSTATVAAGVFAWLMIWRQLPVGRDRGWLPLLGLAVAAAAVTLGVEFAWYRFATKIDPMRVLRGEFDLTYGVHAAGLVLVLGIVAALLAELRAIGQGAFGERPAYAVLVYAAGALVAPAVCLTLGWMTDDLLPEGVSPLWPVLVGIALFALLGLARHWLRGSGRGGALDLFWVAAALYPLALVDDLGMAATVCGALAVLAGGVVAWRAWPVSRGAALLVLPSALGVAVAAVVPLLAMAPG